jgi:hypothetical protein
MDVLSFVMHGFNSPSLLRNQCHPIGNMLKTLDFIGVLKTGGLTAALHRIALGVGKKPLFSRVFMRFQWDDGAPKSCD